ncbi:hypothetical protein MON99_21935, partial [Escherichia coli]
MVYRYSIKKAGPGKNNSNQGKGENQQFSERDALSGGKGHHGKSVIVNLKKHHCIEGAGSDSNLLIVFYVQIMPDDLVMQLHR